MKTKYISLFEDSSCQLNSHPFALLLLQILLALCDKMPTLFDFVGGATYAHTLLKPLEGLATVEDATVRDKALDSIRALIARLPGTSVDNFAVPMVHRMATGDWFTHRLASASLFACVHTCSPSDSTKAELRALYPLLCRDETPMVRRAACSHIGQFAAALDHEQVLQHIVPSLASLAGDEQDSVRLLAVENCIAVAATLTSEDERNELLAPLAIALAHDASWRVRYMVATHIVALCEALGEVCF
jgi:serine/threonine-protein phosphatase 2A regulatory subunit A